MAQPTWTADGVTLDKPRANNLKFALAGGIILLAVILLIAQALRSESQFFITVDEYTALPTKYADRDFRISALVDGDSINFVQIDDFNSRLEFDIVDNLANPSNTMRIVALNQPLPDLLQHEAQAIIEGRVGADGAMYVNPNGLLLKCPTRYEEVAESPAEVTN